jgi:molybdopterin/thiamine biosynthesis adenylyltransferase/proteasome lid subunit RPN8/RPN11
MTTTLVLPEEVAVVIEAAARGSLETAGVVLATRLAADNGDVRLLARRVDLIREDAYIERTHDRLCIASDGYVPSLGEAERLGAVAIWFHTHPGSDAIPVPSRHDHKVDREIADLFRLRSSSDFYGALVVSPRGEGMAFTGTLQPEGGAAVSIDRLWEVGDRWRLTRAFRAKQSKISPVFSRSVRAFGPAIQGTLNDLRIAVVGCGGTGSAVAEQLVRLGVRHLTLIDPDVLSASNVTRVYGSTPKDIERPKAEVLRDHLVAIAPALECEALVSTVTLESTARRLTSRDLVFGCTDDNAGRLVLSRLPTYLLTPVIDVGVLLSSTAAGTLEGIDGRVTTMTPGLACLVCRGRVDLARAAAEQRTPEERRRLEDEGYAPALGAVEPAVVAFTTAVAAAAISELLERLIGYGPQPRPSEVLLRLHEREISTNTAAPRKGHYCDPGGGKLGSVATPFLEQVWPGT